MISERLADSIHKGVRQIGQIAILPDTAGSAYALCHIDDVDRLESLKKHHDPSDARELSIWAADGHYRFTKGELSLANGWLLLLEDASQLRSAIDYFYPAAVGLWLAHQAGQADVQHLRDKLDRQTGMYRFARNLSTPGAQRLISEVCGPENCCAKKILWQIDADTPLEDSEASRFPGRLENGVESIPLLCREACNHFVAEARKASKAEADRKKAISD